MAADPLDELVQFLQPEARIDLKHISLDHLVGLSGSEDGINTLLSKEKIIQSILSLTSDKVDEIAKNALLILVNITATAKGVIELLKFKTDEGNNIVKLLIGYVLNPEKKDADAACMILSNITRVESELETVVDIFEPFLNDILYAFVNTSFNKKGSTLNYIGPVISNLSCCHRIRKWLTEENPHIPLIKILPFCNYEISNIRRGGAIGTIRNLSFDPEFHNFLISNDLELLTYILNPIMGNEEFIDEEMDVLPISLQYLPKEKTRDNDLDIRRMILETLNKLCMRKNGREFLRDNGVYYVLREYHKWEKYPKVRLACENVVDILIQKEDEVGTEDFSTVDVPDDMKEKFEKMDEDYVKDE
ncbi:protein HGH1 homolog [Anticarsia gemmatalis]|uniref:protein HGH1 homolog n=1 Tax=Anticarsia gemmatalis TaxID=129554 RepID=UPI003F774758